MLWIPTTAAQDSEPEENWNECEYSHLNEEILEKHWYMDSIRERIPLGYHWCLFQIKLTISYYTTQLTRPQINPAAPKELKVLIFKQGIVTLM